MKKAIATQAAPAAIGPYSQAIEANGTLFISGQIPLDPATGEFSADDIKGQTRQVFRNIGAILKEAGLGFEHVVQATVYLADIADFAAMNEVYAEFFTAPYPARAAFQVTPEECKGGDRRHGSARIRRGICDAAELWLRCM